MRPAAPVQAEPAPVAEGDQKYVEIGKLVASLAGHLGVVGSGTGTPISLSTLTAPVAAAPVAAPAKKELPSAISGPTINAPLNGTFYRSGSPGKPELAKEGGKVKAGDPICVVEAMKLFNQIKADKPLTIVSFLLKHGDPVSKGQPMAVVKY